MSYYVVKPPRRTSLARVAVLGGVALLVILALLAGWAAAQPIKVMVDGQPRYVPSGTTLYELQKSGTMSAPKGRLMSIDGRVLLADGGHLPAAKRNGTPCESGQRVYSGDVIESVQGQDRLESVVVTDVPLPFRTRYVGDGPLTEMKSLGSPGLSRQTRGLVSGFEVTSTVVRKPTDTVIRRMRPTGKVVALTFDDGPWPLSTRRILDVLAEEEVRATFFMVGKQAARNPHIAKRVAREGHDIGSHSYGHKAFASMSSKGIRKEIKYGRSAVEQATGHRTNWFRPPYGSMDPKAWRQVRDLKVHAVLWDVDSRDWTKPSVKKMRRTVMREVRPGSVVLFHDGGGDRQQTIKALPSIIESLRKKGYEFVTVDELYQMRADAAKRKKAKAKASASEASDS
ncbi:MAG TPA: polysaccharide deacetylase family protein [Coriobacteriia bacterium]|nr:polysaccharide deacetylase family protein [Coriobacteriia bacterium]